MKTETADNGFATDDAAPEGRQMSPKEAEQADALRYRRAEEFYAHCREKEGELRRELTRAIEDVKRAKEKCVALFLENEARAVARRKSGQIVNSSCYGD